MASSPPIFVLCCSRSGSTLLRYILDTHAEIFCPPELHLSQLASQLQPIFRNLSQFKVDATPEQKQTIIAQKIQQHIDDIMMPYAREQQKSIWCEKSVRTLPEMSLIHQVFPNAKYICLYRNCLDQVSSALDIVNADTDMGDYGFDPFIKNANADVINGLVDYWIWMVSASLNYEQFNPKQCFRLPYEAIVNDTENLLKALFKFLGVAWDEQLIDRIFTQERKIGRGDYKIIDTQKIEKSSVGKKTLDVQKISPDRIAKINQLHKAIGYELISQ